MSLVYEDIILKNATEVGMVERGLIKEPEIHETTVRCMVDTGAWTLVINEEVRAALGLKINGSRKSTLANGDTVTSNMTEPVDVWWKDRSTTCRAVVLPNATKILLGAIPLEDMDLMVDPVAEKLVGRHGDEALYTLM
jgi:clan AA aspartic protease